MFEAILSAEPTIRLAAFLGILAAIGIWEAAAPRRRREIQPVLGPASGGALDPRIATKEPIR